MKMGEREEWVCMCVCEREREFQVTWQKKRGERHDWSELTTEQECPNVDGIVREFHSSSTLLYSHSIRHVVVRGRGCISKRFQSNYLFNYRGYANMRFFFFFFSATRSQRRSIHVPRSPLYVRDICPSLLLFDISRSLLDVYRIDNSPLFPRVYIPIS